MTFHNLSILEPTLRNTAVSYRMLVRQNIFTDKVEGPYSCGIVPNGAPLRQKQVVACSKVQIALPEEKTLIKHCQ
jgi:hypothetical protein